MDTKRRSETEGAEKVIVCRESQIGTDTGTTTASYVDTGSVIDTVGSETAALTMRNAGVSNGLLWKVLASIDGTNFVTVQDARAVAVAGVDSYAVNTAAYRYYKAQVKDEVAAAHTTFSASLMTK